MDWKVYGYTDVILQELRVEAYYRPRYIMGLENLKSE